MSDAAATPLQREQDIRRLLRIIEENKRQIEQCRQALIALGYRGLS